ncbi:hypothetical protein KCU78_g3982, partial [Aureobasidium melanogenum]
MLILILPRLFKQFSKQVQASTPGIANATHNFLPKTSRVKQSLFVEAMFPTSIFVVEADLHDKPATHSNSNNNKGTISVTDTITDTKGNQNNKVSVKTASSRRFLFNPIPKPEPVHEPPTSETVDDPVGPKPEPIPRPPTPDPCPPPAPISWKVLWASLSAPTNPSV